MVDTLRNQNTHNKTDTLYLDWEVDICGWHVVSAVTTYPGNIVLLYLILWYAGPYYRGNWHYFSLNDAKNCLLPSPSKTIYIYIWSDEICDLKYHTLLRRRTSYILLCLVTFVVQVRYIIYNMHTFLFFVCVVLVFGFLVINSLLPSDAIKRQMHYCLNKCLAVCLPEPIMISH